jgi:hypothetical protein
MSNGLKATRKGADDVVVAERVVADAFKQLVGTLHPARPPSDPTMPR